MRTLHIQLLITHIVNMHVHWFTPRCARIVVAMQKHHGPAHELQCSPRGSFMYRPVHGGPACTGGANGIGLAICCRLAQEGARVFMADLDEAAAPAALDAVRSAAGGDADVHFVQARLKLSCSCTQVTAACPAMLAVAVETSSRCHCGRT